ncbi:hypothetical protein ACFFX0_26125 [Citricoccus parietis]|uniref:Uncharacterized protein n=1 Tax=Citricoccus parietis TaxID=592307 RepID=A0ABV5G6D4_9MICC
MGARVTRTIPATRVSGAMTAWLMPRSRGLNSGCPGSMIRSSRHARAGLA